MFFYFLIGPHLEKKLFPFLLVTALLLSDVLLNSNVLKNCLQHKLYVLYVILDGLGITRKTGKPK